MSYVLEYNEKNGSWHYNDGRKEENTFNWETLGRDLSDTICTIFCNAMEEKYPSLGTFENPNHKPPYPSFKTLKSEFDLFIFWYQRIPK